MGRQTRNRYFGAGVTLLIALAFIMPGAAVFINMEKPIKTEMVSDGRDPWEMVIDDTTGTVGQTGKVVYVNGTWAASLGGIQCFVFFDNTKLEYWEGDFTGTVMEPMSTKFADLDETVTNMINVGMVVFFEPNPPAGSGMIAKLLFNVSSDAPNGPTPLWFGINPNNGAENLYFDPASVGYAPLLVNGTLTITGGNWPPNTPSNPDPADGEPAADIDTLLSWDSGDQDTSDSVTYDVYFGTSTDPPLVDTIGPYPGSQTSISWDPGTLDYEQTYYWKIEADDSTHSSIGPEWSFTTEANTPPNTPTNPDPFNTETNVDINTQLNWDGGSADPADTIYYDIYFGTSTSPSLIDTIGPYPGSQTNINWDPGTLDYSTTYYWEIVADDGYVTAAGGEWTFTTRANNAPNTPSNPDPFDTETGVDLNQDLYWDGGDQDTSDSVYYDIYFGTSPSPGFVTAIGPYPATTTRISWNPGTLAYNTNYYWKIIAGDGVDTSEGPEWSFTTEANTPPNTPTNPDPFNTETNVDINTQLNWDGGSADPADTIYYDIYFGTSTSPSLIDTIGPYPGSQTNINWDPGTLAYNTDYYWKIEADDGYDTATSTEWTFTTRENDPPNTPNNPDPSNGQTDVTIFTDLSWDGGDPDPGDTVTYDVYFGTTPSPGLVTTLGPYSGSQTRITYDPPSDLDFNTTYYWQIEAHDNYGNDALGTEWTFTTEDEPDAICGDANGDGQVNVADPVFLINHIFKGGPAPDPLCSGDANGDGQVNVADPVYLINYIFKGGPPPVEPCCPWPE